MNINIRKAQLDDLKDIQELNNELFKKEFKEYDDSLMVGWPFGEYGEKYFKDAIEKLYLLVATDNDNIVGYFLGTLHGRDSYHTNNIAVLENTFIKEEYRNKGIGSQFMQSFLKHCKDNNINDIRVTASYMNLKAINFYKKYGFKEFEITLRNSD